MRINVFFDVTKTDDYRKSRNVIKAFIGKNSKRIGADLTISEYLKLVNHEIARQSGILNLKYPNQRIEF